ncbi:hypothetical protein C2I18_27775 [Paenibacillus sp. PK3_47]|uniref:hypothetical protein n=1 Tax=Paenibacillus sp. PK3_47 TaxID=2072642 RepID=UPI00201D5A4D|nr:hypothetical protein [Paenibacillus sp. PK3_47]UQZ36999.1 hypothetical protein C2I18_27775 [Paenibacillus sp. PK3_47]
MKINNTEEKIISNHSEQQWRRREKELTAWLQRSKQKQRPKQTAYVDNIEIDIELLGTLTLLRRMNIQTEFSCAGVSILDEPQDHSLYGYLTLIASSEADQFVKIAMQYMRHRLLVTYEPSRNRYDLSSFYIGHNRSFCLLLEKSAQLFQLGR